MLRFFMTKSEISVIGVQNKRIIKVTVQAGLCIYCADRMKK